MLYPFYGSCEERIDSLLRGFPCPRLRLGRQLGSAVRARSVVSPRELAARAVLQLWALLDEVLRLQVAACVPTGAGAVENEQVVSSPSVGRHLLHAVDLLDTSRPRVGSNLQHFPNVLRDVGAIQQGVHGFGL